MKEIWWTFTAAFVVYRLATDLAQSEGPFRVFERIRNLYLANDWVGRGLRCPLCVSFWVAGVVALTYTPLTAPEWMWHSLALAGMARFLIKATQRTE